MKPTDFSKYLTDFFGTYLPIECGVSQNTILTYSYTFSLLIEFLKEQEFINPQRVTLADITKERIINFLQWLEEDRHCSVSTRNARLAAIRSFYSYLQYRDVKGMFRYHEIMSIRKKKTAAPEMAYLTIDGIKLILSQPDLKTRYGRRDFVLLSLLYDSGARVQELIDLTPPNIEFNDTATVKLCGKGNKARIVPLSKQQASNLKKYMYDEGLMKEDRHCVPIFCNFNGEKLSLYWQWNHNPVDDKWSLTERPGYLRLETSRVVDNLYLAPNTITQRMEGPKCKATVSLDISNMKDGDVAGFSAFNGHSGLLSVVKEGDAKRLVMSTSVVNFDNTPNKAIASVDVEEKEQVELNQNIIYLRIEGDFTPKRDIATFYYSLDNKV